LGFNIESIKQSFWDKSPHLANIETIAKKNIHLSNPNLLRNAGSLLKDFTVSPVEEATYNSWLTQLENFLNNKKDTKNNIFNSSVDNSIPLNQIHNFNQLNRDKWIINKANNIKAGSKVIDIGAGTCPYKSLFNHCDYYAHDFKKYSGEKLGGTKDYADIDIVSDIESIPVNDESFDVVICTEVLEHVPEPIKALKEMSRILKKGGTILITAPLGSGLHQLPYHYYGGYTPEWYKKFLIESGIEIQEITPNGGFFKHLAQECARVAWKFGLHKNYHNNPDEVYNMFYNELPRLLYSLDDNCFIEDFTVGYFVEGIKR
jgi:ubiquinone/menaquinone biosynthesis C-methylase UbiE